MDKHTAVDATKGGGDGPFYVLGVAIEVGDRQKFNEHYFATIAGFFDRYGFSTPFPVIKSADIMNYLPSFKIGSSIRYLSEELAANPGIDRMTAVVGWYDETAELHNGRKERGIQFASNILHQYFPVVTLWQHYEINRRRDLPPIPDAAVVDNVSGHITDCWNTVGNEFDLRLVPNGDVTYPSVSTADIIASSLRGSFPSNGSLNEYQNRAHGWLMNSRHESEPYVRTSSVNEECSDQIVPRYPYTIHSELHYPHPVVFVHDVGLEGSSKDVLQSTRLYNQAAQYAHRNDGCIVNLEVSQWPFTVESGDILLHTSPNPDEKVEHLCRLTPDLDVEVHSPASFSDRYG
jgi:hypothetical protein